MTSIQRAGYQIARAVKAVVKKQSNEELLKLWRNDISIKKLVRDVKSDEIQKDE